MKVILTADVENLGAEHEIVEVADGYARNYLVPRSMAIPATKSAISQLDNMKRVGERRHARLRAAASEQATQLEGKVVVLPARVGAKGRLFGSISAADIAEQLKKDFNVEIDRKNIVLGEPLRTAGVHSVPVNLHRDVKIQLLVQIGDDAQVAAAAGEAPAEAAPASA